MPEGPEIFETTGVWEDYSTPSRDLALLGAIDLIRGFPQSIVDRPGRYALGPGETPAAAQARLEGLLRDRSRQARISYKRSNGSDQSLTIEELLGRTTAFEMAYNPNDCVELRWGAPANSDEAATCKRYAPKNQRAKMTEYRPWFSERRRPPRS